jgi:hypothetical protein
MVVTQLEVPQATAVAKPDELIEATLASLDTQPRKFGLPARFSVVGGALKDPIAMNCAVPPMVFSVWLLGMMVIAVNSRWSGTPVVTFRVAVPTTGPKDPFMVAVMVVVPTAKAVARPEELMVATPVLLDAQVASSVIFCVVVGCEPPFE